MLKTNVSFKIIKYLYYLYSILRKTIEINC